MNIEEANMLLDFVSVLAVVVAIAVSAAMYSIYRKDEQDFYNPNKPKK